MTKPASAAARSFAPRLLPVESLVYRSETLWIGSFRCPVEDPLFVDSGPASAHLFVFPRTSVRIPHAGQEPFVANPTVATFYNPGDQYRRTRISAEGDHCDWFALAAESVSEVVACEDPWAAALPEKAFRFTHGPSDASTYFYQRLVLDHASRWPIPDRLYVEEAALWILGRLVRDAYALRGGPDRASTVRDASVRGRELAEAAQILLGERLSEPLSLGEVARAVGNSVYHLCRVFRRVTGTTLHAYRNQLRLRRSLALLVERSREITDLALELGYSSHSHFSFAFRRAFGVSPAEFSRSARGAGFILEPRYRPGAIPQPV